MTYTRFLKLRQTQLTLKQIMEKMDSHPKQIIAFESRRIATYTIIAEHTPNQTQTNRHP